MLKIWTPSAPLLPPPFWRKPPLAWTVLKMEQETKEALVAAALKALGQVVEGQQVFPPFLSPGHGGDDFQQACAAVQF